MIWRNMPVVIMASGPSLSVEQIEHVRRSRVRDRCRVVVINETWRACPIADVLYGADAAWWANRAPTADEFKGERVSVQAQWSPKQKYEQSDVRLLTCITTGEGLFLGAPDTVASGHNSGFQALNLAVNRGSKCIVFVGLDMKPSAAGKQHWHDDHVAPLRNQSPYEMFRKPFEKVAPMLAHLGVRVVNASPDSALTCFECRAIWDVL